MTDIVELFEGLEEDQAHRIVSAGIEMMSAITDAYGPGTGTELWNKFQEVLGEEAKHAILISMLQGGGSNIITLLPMNADQRREGSKVAAIKATRKYTGMGLKEAKEAIEVAWGRSTGFDNSITTQPKIHRIKIMGNMKRSDFMQELREAGIPCR